MSLDNETDQKKALKAVVAAVLESLHPEGTPAGTLYAGLMAYGCTLSQFEALISGLVSVGAIGKQGHLLLPGGAK